jgi:hypothetical protein
LTARVIIADIIRTAVAAGVDAALVNDIERRLPVPCVRPDR